MLIIAAILGFVGIGALLYFEAKIIGTIVTGIAALFMLLSFINTQEASTLKVQAVKQRDSAEFDRDFARASGNTTKEEMKVLSARVDVAIKKEADETVKTDAAFAKAKASRDAIENKISSDDDVLVPADNNKTVKLLGE